MAQYDITPERTFTTPYAADERVTVLLRSVYGWMCGGPGITALVAFFVSQSPSLVLAIAGNRLLYWGLMIAQLGIVFYLSARVERIAAGTASLLFVLYSALTGVTFAFILLAFTGESIATTFMICAAMFGSLALLSPLPAGEGLRGEGNQIPRRDTHQTPQLGGGYCA